MFGQRGGTITLLSPEALGGKGGKDLSKKRKEEKIGTNRKNPRLRGARIANNRHITSKEHAYITQESCEGPCLEGDAPKTGLWLRIAAGK